MAHPRGTEQHGDDRPGMIPFGDLETALRREADAVAERFPDTDFAVVDTAVREVFAELRAEAAVETHILALTRNRAFDRLEEQGHTFRAAPAAEAEPEPAEAEPDAGAGPDPAAGG
jgi:hypothetical protein